MEMDRTINDADEAPAIAVSVQDYQEDAFGVTIESLMISRVTILTPGGARLLIAALSEAATMAENNRREFDGESDGQAS